MDVALAFLHAVNQRSQNVLTGYEDTHAHDLCVCLLQLESSDDDSIGTVGQKAPASSRIAPAGAMSGQAAAHMSAGTMHCVRTLSAAARTGAASLCARQAHSRTWPVF